MSVVSILESSLGTLLGLLSFTLIMSTIFRFNTWYKAYLYKSALEFAEKFAAQNQEEILHRIKEELLR